MVELVILCAVVYIVDIPAAMKKCICLCNSAYSICEPDRQSLLQTVCSALLMDSDSPTQSLSSHFPVLLLICYPQACQIKV